jgi:hypothetical protein
MVALCGPWMQAVGILSSKAATHPTLSSGRSRCVIVIGIVASQPGMGVAMDALPSLILGEEREKSVHPE